MKKHLVAFLSMIGLAGVGAPTQAQVLKGSKEPTRKESKVKHSKNTQNSKAVQTHVQDKSKDKLATTNTDNKAVKTDLGKNAANDQSKLKVKQETLRNQTNNGQKNALTKAGLTKAALTKGALTKAKNQDAQPK